MKEQREFCFQIVSSSRFIAFLFLLIYPFLFVFVFIKWIYERVEEVFIGVLTLVSPTLAQKFLQN